MLTRILTKCRNEVSVQWNNCQTYTYKYLIANDLTSVKFLIFLLKNLFESKLLLIFAYIKELWMVSHHLNNL